eukprot:gene14760-14932_t
MPPSIPTSDGASPSDLTDAGRLPKGRHFSFQQYKNGAAGFLAKLSPEKIDTIIHSSNLADLNTPLDTDLVQAQSAVHISKRNKLAKLLDEDDDLGVDVDHEALVFRCNGLKLAAAEAAAALSEEVASAAAEIGSSTGPTDVDPDPSLAFQLSSRPAATKKIWLDFQGGIVTGTAWGASVTVPAFDTDGSPTTFSTSERTTIVAVWRAVAEDYSFLDVDVTTINPGSLAGRGIRCMIGGDGTYVNAGGAGGIAYIGAFGKASLGPAFVFPKNLGPNFAKFIWEAASHEVGHTLGLQHDGSSSGSYYMGQGNWAPIMGAGYQKQVTQFDRGEYAGSNNPQDDIKVILSQTYSPGLIQSQNGYSVAT